MELKVDITFYYQLLIFLSLFFLLNILLFQPILKVIEARRKGTSGERDEVEKLKRQAEEKSRLYEKKMEEAKREGLVIKDGLKKSGEEEASKILSEARLQADQNLRKLEQEIQQEEVKGKDWLKANLPVLGKQLAEQVLGRSV
ncbi:MAG: ATP synthase F0 subunit B [Deltaproteobacteria bacterium]|nr:ATP synthase F0 subunit B [Deltaproteobacteria bacterium]